MLSRTWSGWSPQRCTAPLSPIRGTVTPGIQAEWRPLPFGLVKAHTYPRVETTLPLPAVVELIRSEGENKSYMGGFKRLGTFLNGGIEWYTPDDDPFAAAHALGKPDFGLGVGGPGWSAVFYVWDKGDKRMVELQRSTGVDSGPPKRLCERIIARLSR